MFPGWAQGSRRHHERARPRAKKLPASCLSHVHGCPESHNLKPVWLTADARQTIAGTVLCTTCHNQVCIQESVVHIQDGYFTVFSRNIFIVQNTVGSSLAFGCLQETLVCCLLTFNITLKTQSVLFWGISVCLCACRIRSSRKVPLR